MVKKMQDASTRNIILELLKTNSSLTVGELSQKLDITEMAVRRHLNNMERDGLIEAKLIRKAMGRPSQTYYLTPQADEMFPRNYEKFALEMLDQLNETDPTKVDQIFSNRKNKLIEQYAGEMDGETLQGKIDKLVSLQNDNGYMVNYEKDDDGNYVIQESNCPISQIASRYNQACQCELELFQSVLNTDVEQKECQAKGGNKCTYWIKSSS
ncbi:helix-turn-helix transcriptional regulator [Longirhabdus pacifica]|uniref:helix-turn-helix transcriptional regulator n=1 Tax=Longirhabdus pacifica TaxID=2305227 RepID=UPI001008D2E7|nr:metalloregulator ArsR/SmtB family transcription factor [Longirhabdus pacifica]